MRNETINTFAKLLSCFFLMSGLYVELCHGDTVAEICEVSPGKDLGQWLDLPIVTISWSNAESNDNQRTGIEIEYNIDDGSWQPLFKSDTYPPYPFFHWYRPPVKRNLRVRVRAGNGKDWVESRYRFGVYPKIRKVNEVGDPFKDWNQQWDKRGWLFNPLDYNKWVPGKEGKAPLPPRWVFEPMRYDNEYNNWQNVIWDLRKHLEYDIPATTWHIDRPSLDFYNWLTPAESFVIPGHKEYWDKAPRQGTALVREFAKRGLRFGLYVTNWGVLPKEYQMRGCWNLDGPDKIKKEIEDKSIDMNSPEGIGWWLERCGFKDMYNQGVRFVKCDYDVSSSPFVLRDVQSYVNEHYPHPVVFMGGHSPSREVSRYNCAIWTGDPLSNFEGLRKFGFHKELELFRNSGLYYVGTDVGGFIHGNTAHWNRNCNQDVFLRWCGHSVFSEIWMSTFWLWSKKQPQLWPDHYDYVPGGSPREDLGFKTKGGYTTKAVLAWDDPNNPLTPIGNKFLDIYRYWATLCYELVPYKFSYAHVAHNTGKHIRRFCKISPTVRDNYQYLCGHWFLNVPIVAENMDNSTDKPNPLGGLRRVKVPAGYWYDWWKPIRYAGPAEGYFDYRGDWARHPILVRAGAIIPLDVMNDATGHGRLASKHYLTLDVYPSEKPTAIEFYEGEAGSAPHRLECSPENGGFAIGFGGRKGDYILRIAVQSAKDVRYGNKRLTSVSSADGFWATEKPVWFFDDQAKRLWIRIHHGKNNKQVRIGGVALYPEQALPLLQSERGMKK